MLRTLFAMVAAFLVFSAARPQDNFPPVNFPQLDPELEFRQLVKTGLMSEFEVPLSGVIGREEIARRLCQLLDQAKERMRNVKFQSHDPDLFDSRSIVAEMHVRRLDWLQRFDESLPAFMRLFASLERELATHGVKVEAERKWLSRYKSELRELPFVLDSKRNIVRSGRNMMPDGPENHRIWERLAEMKRAGLLVSPPTRGRNMPFTRPEVAMMAASTYEHIRGIHATFSGPSGAAGPFDAAELEHLRKNARTIDAIAKHSAGLLELIDGFSDLVAELGVDPRGARIWLHAVGEQARALAYGLIREFPDVPEGHWAAKQVEELRKLGLLRGYPGGKFRG